MAESVTISTTSDGAQAEQMAPVGKLDADNYHAEDLEGVTESLFGSGNLNHLTLQGRQTDAMLAGGGFDIATGKNETDMLASGLAAASGHVFMEERALSMGGGAASGDADVSSPAFSAGFENIFHAGSPESAAAGAGPAVSAVAAVASPASTTSFSGTMENFTPNATGHDGAAGHDGATGGGTTIVNNDPVTVNHNPPASPGDIISQTTQGVTQAVGSIIHDATSAISQVGDILNNTLQGAGDTVNGMLNSTLNTVHDTAGGLLHDAANGVLGTLDANPAVHTVTDTVNTVLGDALNNGAVHDVTGIVGDITGHLPDVSALAQNPLGTVNGIVHDVSSGLADATSGLPVVGDILGHLPDLSAVAQDPVGAVTNIVQDVPATVHDITSSLGGTLDSIGNIAGDVDVVANVTHSVAGAGVGLDAVLADVPDISTVAQDPVAAVTNLVQDVPAAVHDVVGAVADTVADLTSGLTPPAGPDTDLSVHNDLGLPQVNVNLDPVESIVGDINVAVNVTHDSSGLTVDAGALALGTQVPDTAVSVPVPDLLGSISSIAGQAASVDTSASAAISLLTHADTSAVSSDPVASTLSGGTTVAWTDTTAVANDTVSSLGDLVDTAAHAGGLPEPSGTVSDGLGLVTTTTDHHSGLLSGSHGGLL